jgi:hypothetical protein
MLVPRLVAKTGSGTSCQGQSSHLLIARATHWPRCSPTHNVFLTASLAFVKDLGSSPDRT